MFYLCSLQCPLRLYFWSWIPLSLGSSGCVSLSDGLAFDDPVTCDERWVGILKNILYSRLVLDCVIIRQGFQAWGNHSSKAQFSPQRITSLTVVIYHWKCWPWPLGRRAVCSTLKLSAHPSHTAVPKTHSLCVACLYLMNLELSFIFW